MLHCTLTYTTIFECPIKQNADTAIHSSQTGDFHTVYRCTMTHHIVIRYTLMDVNNEDSDLPSTFDSQLTTMAQTLLLEFANMSQ